MKISTLLTTLGRFPEDHCGVVNPPVYRASTLLFPSLAEFEGWQKGTYPYVYGRTGTPATHALEAAFAELDGMDHAILTASGLSAIVVTLMSFLSSGDHLLASDNVYGSMRQFCEQELKRFGVEVTYYDPMIGAGIEALIRPNTKIIYCESPGSLTFEVQDVAAIAEAAHQAGCLVMMDNTWATPLFYRAVDFGVDIVLHSCTKYIGGHSDLIMGLITCSRLHYPQLRRTFRNLGACVGADEVYLAARGLRTLAVRLKQHEETGKRLAEWCKARPELLKLLHPAFPDCPGHAQWKRDFKGASGLFGLMLRPHAPEAIAFMLNGMELFGIGYSWGGYESLVIPFTPQRATGDWPQEATYLRLHAGLEDADDLIADLEAGFKRLSAWQ
jgi:cystathionine beta-lyase